jgi:hypothetical protein
VARNSCRGPAVHRLDLRASHTVRVRETPVTRDADGRLRALLPYTLDPAASRWHRSVSNSADNAE